MSALMRFDPFRDFDRLAEQIVQSGGRGSPRSFPMDAYRRGDQFFVHLDLPGVEAESIELTAENNVLTVSAERRFESEDGDQILVRERPQGQFIRQLLLGQSLDEDKIEANYENGVLTLAIPVAEKAKPKRISVGSSGVQKQSRVNPSARVRNFAERAACVEQAVVRDLPVSTTGTSAALSRPPALACPSVQAAEQRRPVGAFGVSGGRCRGTRAT